MEAFSQQLDNIAGIIAQGQENFEKAKDDKQRIMSIFSLTQNASQLSLLGLGAVGSLDSARNKARALYYGSDNKLKQEAIDKINETIENEEPISEDIIGDVEPSFMDQIMQGQLNAMMPSDISTFSNQIMQGQLNSMMPSSEDYDMDSYDIDVPEIGEETSLEATGETLGKTISDTAGDIAEGISGGLEEAAASVEAASGGLLSLLGVGLGVAGLFAGFVGEFAEAFHKIDIKKPVIPASILQSGVN